MTFETDSEAFKLPFVSLRIIESLVQTRTRSGRFSAKPQATEETSHATAPRRQAARRFPACGPFLW